MVVNNMLVTFDLDNFIWFMLSLQHFDMNILNKGVWISVWLAVSYTYLFLDERTICLNNSRTWPFDENTSVKRNEINKIEIEWNKYIGFIEYEYLINNITKSLLMGISINNILTSQQN